MSEFMGISHAKGPVRVIDGPREPSVRNRDGLIAKFYPYGNADDAQRGLERVAALVNARRGAAVWNACEGIPTDALEAGVVWEMVEALERCKEIIDDLECECDSYHGFECSIHKDRELVRGVLAKARGEAS